MSQITLSDIQSKIIHLREQEVIIDSDVAELYAVPTKYINQAVKNNPRKFPDGYIFALSDNEWGKVKSKILTSPPLGGGKVKMPNAFTEKGLYMLATILKSDQAIETTIAIIEAYAKLRQLSKNIKQLSITPDDQKKKQVLQKNGEMITELLGSVYN